MSQWNDARKLEAAYGMGRRHDSRRPLRPNRERAIEVLSGVLQANLGWEKPSMHECRELAGDLIDAYEKVDG